MRANRLELVLLSLVGACAPDAGSEGTADTGDGSGESSTGDAGTSSESGSESDTGSTEEGGDACAGTSECVGTPPPEWSGPVVVALPEIDAADTCPPGWMPATGAESWGDLNVPDLGCGCQDATLEGSCSPPVLQGYQNQACTTPGGNPIVLDEGVCKGNFVFLYFIVSEPELENVACTATATQLDVPPSFGTRTLACAPPDDAPPCQDGVCVDATELPGAIGICLYQDGEVDCPPSHPDRHVRYRSFADQRSCTCDVDVQDASCDGTLTGWWGDPCFGNQAMIGYDSCTYAQTQSWQWDGGLAGGCTAPSPVQLGDVEPTEPITFCCAG